MNSGEPPVGTTPQAPGTPDGPDDRTPTAPTPKHGHRGWRWTGAVVLLLVAALLVTASVIARYARGEIIDTSKYVATVAPLASDPAVQNAVTARASDAVIAKIDVPQLVNELAAATGRPNAPAIANLIAGPVNDYVQNLVHSKVQEFVSSPQFETLWVNANTAAHTQLSGLLTGRGTDVIKAEGDQITLEVGPIVTQVKQRLIDSGFSAATKIPAVSLQVPVMTVENLPQIQSYVRLLDNLATWLPLVALLLLALAIWLAPSHRRAALIGAAMIAVLMVVLLIALNAIRNAYENDVANRDLNVPAALALYDTLLRYLVHAIEALLIVCVVAIVWLWLSGPGRAGRFVRHWGHRAEQAAADSLERTKLRFGSVPRFAARFGMAVTIGFAVLAGWAFLRSPTIGLALWLSAGIVVIMLIVGTLARLPSRSPARIATT